MRWRGKRRSRVSCVSGEREEMLSFDSERYVSRSLHRAPASFQGLIRQFWPWSMFRRIIQSFESKHQQQITDAITTDHSARTP